MKRLLLTSLICLSVLACSKQEDATPEEAANTAATPAAELPVSPTVPAAEPAATTAVAETISVGIPECDDFLTAYNSCLAEKVPEQTREVMREGYVSWARSWQEMAANETTKAQLAEVCTRTKDSTKTVMEMYGCQM